jgi:hypothetical protein
MSAHDIIANRKERLIDHPSQMLGSNELAGFAVGYLFLSGLTSAAKRLLSLRELRLLIGNTTNREPESRGFVLEEFSLSPAIARTGRAYRTFLKTKRRA